MKKLASLICLLAGIAIAQGQGGQQFTAHLTSTNTDLTADGVFLLTNTTFSYQLNTPFGFFQANIQGPGSDSSAPVVFNLHNTYCLPPLGPDPGGCLYSGTFTLTDDQISQLEAGQWYGNAIPETGSFYALRGEVVSVPEPSPLSVAILVLASGLSIQFYRSRPKVALGKGAPVHRGLLAVLIHAASLLMCNGQGLVNFNNNPSTFRDSASVDRFVYLDFIGGTKLTGTNFAAQLFYALGADQPADSLVPVTSAPAHFFDSSVTSRLGVWFGGIRTLDNVPCCTYSSLQVRVWDASIYTTWDSAVVGGASRGVSAVFDYVPPTPGIGTADLLGMYGLRAFVAPEPSTLTVGVLGLAGLVFLSRGRLVRKNRGRDALCQHQGKRVAGARSCFFHELFVLFRVRKTWEPSG